MKGPANTKTACTCVACGQRSALRTRGGAWLRIRGYRNLFGCRRCGALMRLGWFGPRPLSKRAAARVLATLEHQPPAVAGATRPHQRGVDWGATVRRRVRERHV